MDWEHYYFHYWSPSVNLCHDDVSADDLIKCVICNGETCRVDDFVCSAVRNMSIFITQSICLG